MLKGILLIWSADYFEKSSIDNYMVEIGGEVRCKGVNDKGKLWRIGIDKPVDNNNGTEHKLQAVVELNNESVSTSGNYRRFYIKNGGKVFAYNQPIYRLSS